MSEYRANIPEFVEVLRMWQKAVTISQGSGTFRNPVEGSNEIARQLFTGYLSEYIEHGVWHKDH